MKLWTKIAAATVGVVVVAVAAVPLFVNVNTFRPLLEEQLTTALGRQVKLGTMSLALFAVVLFAQETPTEREAARDVIGKMDELETSLNVRTIVEKIMAANPARDEAAARAKQLMEKELLEMCDDITKHPEIGFEELVSSLVRAELDQVT